MIQPAIRTRFLEAMSRIPATVTVVTTDGPHGRFGVTVSAMSSVSADTPCPTVLVCVNQSSRAAAPLLANGIFAVNVLQATQTRLAAIFAGQGSEPGFDRFNFGKWELGSTGAPLLSDALATFDCRVKESHLVGTHHVIFGAVETICLAEEGRTLVYADRAFAVSVPLAAPV